MTATPFAATINDAARFGAAKQVRSYLGFVPRELTRPPLHRCNTAFGRPGVAGMSTLPLLLQRGANYRKGQSNALDEEGAGEGVGRQGAIGQAKFVESLLGMAA